MDGISLLVGIALGGAVCSAVGYWLASAKAQARGAVDRVAAEMAVAETVALRAERDSLRAEHVSALRADAASKASLSAAQESVGVLRSQCEAERARADDVAASLSTAQIELRAKETSVAEREHAMRKQLEERERSLEELRRTVDQSRDAMRDAFKATGAELLHSTSESLLKQAKEQFEGQHKLTAQELVLRQQAMEATLAPLREQLEKQQALVQSLGEKREGDAKELSERLRVIGELQLKASDAANTLSSAMRDNRQRGKWGELGLRRVVEMAGLQMHVDFDEQTQVEGEAGAIRPDMIVHLPEHRSIPIDSKVPFDSYLASLDTSLDDAKRLAHRQAHAVAVRGHVKALSRRAYGEEFDGANGFTVLFMQIESAYNAALECDPKIHEEALSQKVYVMTPTNLLALLSTVAQYWGSAALSENAAKIGAEATELIKRMAKFVELFDSVGTKLSSATKAYNEAVGSFDGRLLVTVNRIAQLASAAPVEAPALIEAQSRVSCARDILELPASEVLEVPS